jgi:hypothetical protein
VKTDRYWDHVNPHGVEIAGKSKWSVYSEESPLERIEVINAKSLLTRLAMGDLKPFPLDFSGEPHQG